MMPDAPKTADGFPIERGTELYRVSREGVYVYEVLSVDSRGVIAIGRHRLEQPSEMFASLTKAHEAEDRLHAE